MEFNQISDEYIGDSKIINHKNDPCDEFKNKLSICMKNSDDNIMACQEIRNVYESCLRQERLRSK
tara:strand:+ start:5259 stop:5453 length:195 start_codon:yes stop_codon:yes gene_type:complete